jgi:hypothetical protein
MFEFAVQEGALTVNPIAKVEKLKEIRAERPRVSETDLRRILKHLPFPVRQIVLFIYETCWRPSEALCFDARVCGSGKQDRDYKHAQSWRQSSDSPDFPSGSGDPGGAHSPWMS